MKENQGQPIGILSDNPILDTIMYEVDYQDGHSAALAENLIAENLFYQVDEEGNRSVLFDEIIDVRTDGTQVLQQDTFVTTSSGTQRRVRMTKGWDVNLKWKDTRTTWNKQKDIKTCTQFNWRSCGGEKNIREISLRVVGQIRIMET